MNKKIGILFVFYLFYKIYKSKNKLLFFIFRLTSKGNKYIKNKQLKALTTIKEKVNAVKSILKYCITEDNTENDITNKV